MAAILTTASSDQRFWTSWGRWRSTVPSRSHARIASSRARGVGSSHEAGTAAEHAASTAQAVHAVNPDGFEARIGTECIAPGACSIARPMATETVLILDFGSQFAQLIARRVRELGVFSLLVAPGTPIERIRSIGAKGIILSGGPSSVFDEGAPTCDPAVLDLGIPVLGICYGMQLGCRMLGCDVRPAAAREYGRAQLDVGSHEGLLHGLPARTTVWMSHGDQVRDVHGDLRVLASTDTCPVAAVAHRTKPFFGVQFHPEVTHTPHGVDILRNFLYAACGCAGNWRMADFLERETARVRDEVGSDRVICGLSGGVDSSVVAALLARAIGPRLTCIFVDNGLLRNGERDLVESTFRGAFEVDLRVVDASRALPPTSSCTTTSGGFPRTSGFGSSSRCATSSRTRSGGWARCWRCRRRSCGATRSRGPASRCASSGRSRPSAWRSCATATRSSSRRSCPRTSTGPRARCSRCCFP